MKSFKRKTLVLAIALFMLPSINIFGIYTHFIGKFLIIALFIFYLIEKEKKNYSLSNSFKLIIFLFILSHVISIFKVVNLVDFIKRFYDFIIPTIVFLLIILNKNFQLEKKLMNILLFSFVINTILEFFLFLNSGFFLSTVGFFLHPTYPALIQKHLNAGKLYFFPWTDSLLIYVYSYKKNIFVLIFLIIKTYLMLTNGFRISLLMIIFSMIFFLCFLNKKNTKKNFLFLNISLFFLFNIFNYSFLNKKIVIERMFLLDVESLSTATFRLKQIMPSLTFGIENIFGAGLGNYLNYIDNKKFYSIINKDEREIAITTQIPHNIFLEKMVETGLFGFFTTALLLIFLLIKDIYKFKQLSDKKKALIGCFWSLFIYSLFNPTGSNLTFNVLFFLFRGLIE